MRSDRLRRMFSVRITVHLCFASIHINVTYLQDIDHCNAYIYAYYDPSYQSTSTLVLVLLICVTFVLSIYIYIYIYIYMFTTKLILFNKLRAVPFGEWQ